MEKRTGISLRVYFTRALILALGCAILIVAIVFAVFFICLGNGICYPANAGETRARAELNRQRAADHFTADLTEDLYDYIALDPQDHLIASSLPDDAAIQKIAEYPDKDFTYTLASYLAYSDGSSILFLWDYKSDWVNPWLQKMLPSVDISMILLGIVLMLIFFLCYVRGISRKFTSQLELMTEASDQIGAQNLSEPIAPAASIHEFNQTLQSMEDMRKALQASLTAQWQAEQQRKEDIAALTHDLKTPLTIISGNAELLLEEPIDAGQEKLVEAIHSAGNRAKQYVAALQQMSSFDAVEEMPTHVNMQAVLDEVASALRPLAAMKSVSLSMDNRITHSIIQVYPSLLNRALINIGENAIRFTPKGSAVTFNVMQTNEITTFSFEDEGSGFTAEGLANASKTFWQADKSRQGSTNFGLGLAIAKKAAEQHGGKLLLSNKPNGGCVQLVIKNNRG